MITIKKLALVILLAAASTAQATPLSYTFQGPNFTSFIGSAFSTTSHISGSVSFNDTLLDSSGNGILTTDARAPNIGFGWSFTDGKNTFSNTSNNNNYTIQIGFTNFMPSYWNIDTTWGVTGNADIFVHSGNGANVSYFKYGQVDGGYGAGPAATAANWTRVMPAGEVPEPAGIALFGLGAAGLAFLRRRQAK